MKSCLRPILLLSALLLHAAVHAETAPAAPGPVQHVVIVWLKNHGSTDARAQYIEATRELARLPMVQDYRIGTPLPGGGREVVDSSYDVAIVASFENAEALDAYEKHPEHDRILRERLKPLVDKVLVYEYQVVR